MMFKIKYLNKGALFKTNTPTKIVRKSFDFPFRSTIEKSGYRRHKSENSINTSIWHWRQSNLLVLYALCR